MKGTHEERATKPDRRASAVAKAAVVEPGLEVRSDDAGVGSGELGPVAHRLAGRPQYRDRDDDHATPRRLQGRSGQVDKISRLGPATSPSSLASILGTAVKDTACSFAVAGRTGNLK